MTMTLRVAYCVQVQVRNKYFLSFGFFFRLSPPARPPRRRRASLPFSLSRIFCVACVFVDVFVLSRSVNRRRDECEVQGVFSVVACFHRRTKVSPMVSPFNRARVAGMRVGWVTFLFLGIEVSCAVVMIDGTCANSASCERMRPSV